jgi:DNA (cytosine-5)-methyltransferase 1
VLKNCFWTFKEDTSQAIFIVKVIMVHQFKFIDLFSGIGGFHQAMSNLGGECVFAAEIDDDAIETYGINFGMNSRHNMFEIEPSEVPTHDVLCAGFPCQPFSIAGKQKGFEDTRGTLFFEIARIAKAKQPKILLL